MGLLKRMRSATTLGAGQDRLDAILRNFKLLRDFGDADAIIEVVDDRPDRQPGATQYGSAALDVRIDLNQSALRPINLLLGGRISLSAS